MQSIAYVAKTHPALARALEIGLYSMSIYILGAIVEGQIWSLNGAIVALLTPIVSALQKKLRDIKK